MQGNISHVLEFMNISTRINYVGLVLTVTSCAFLFFTLFVGIAANVFVAWAVHNQKSLQTSNNALLVNLAVIDFLRCVIDCPLILVIFLNGDTTDQVGFSLCNAQFASFSITCCVQLLTLASISAERYQAIAHPFETTERRKRVMIWIPSTWTVAILLSILCLLFVKDSSVYVKCKGMDIKELPSYDTFGMYILMPLWTACLAVIVGFYARIFILVKAHRRKIFDKGIVRTLDDTNGNAKSTKVTNESTIKEIINIVPEVTVKTDFTYRAQEEPASTDNILPCENNTVSAPFHTTDHDLTLDRHHTETKDSSRVFTENSDSTKRVSSSQTRALVVIDLEKREDDCGLQPQPLNTVSESATLQSAGEKQTDTQTTIPPEPENQGDIAGAVCMMPSHFNSDRAKKNKEGKLAKRSGYIILTFLLFWTPFIATVLANYFINFIKYTSVSISSQGQQTVFSLLTHRRCLYRL